MALATQRDRLKPQLQHLQSPYLYLTHYSTRRLRETRLSHTAIASRTDTEPNRIITAHFADLRDPPLERTKAHDLAAVLEPVTIFRSASELSVSLAEIARARSTRR